MKQMKMDWIPYIPSEDRLKSQIFILSCTQRRAALKHLKLDQVKKYEYCLPYFYHPFKEDELEQSTEVQILFPTEPKPVFCSFDWKFNDLEEFSDELIKDEELSADQKDEFKDFVKEKVREAKKANKEV
ncbi:protein HEAT INTOLERANT 4-like [Arachis hypogaea]|uniref:protein HEAT INTOLERANT 4-like n=1 Tax=Arachis hypogaea TaxID=3818 RepID=UPI003B20E2BD